MALKSTFDPKEPALRMESGQAGFASRGGTVDRNDHAFTAATIWSRIGNRGISPPAGLALVSFRFRAMAKSSVTARR